MRRLFAAALILLLSASLSASSMKLYDRYSDEYRMLSKICVLSGVVGPSSATPVTENEMIIAFERGDRSKLNQHFRSEYGKLKEILYRSADSFSYDFDITFSPQLFLTRDQDSIRRKQFFIDSNQEDPFLSIGAKLEFGKHLYIEALYPVMNARTVHGTDNTIDSGLAYTSFDFLFNFRNNSFNVLTITDPVVPMFAEFPIVARAAVGADWFSFVIGRSRQQFGNGFTGNLIIGDNFDYQEFMKITASSSFLTYTLDLTQFDTQVEKNGVIETMRPHISGMHNGRIMHRVDANVLDRARVVANLGFAFYADEIADFRLLFPLMNTHAWNNFRDEPRLDSDADFYDEANNIAGIEAEWVIMPGLRAGLQFALDQYQAPNEGDEVPSALALMANSAYMLAFRNFDVDLYVEGVFTSSGMYMNYKYDEKGTNWNYDWIFSYRRQKTTGDVNWSGHTFGPGVFAIALGSDFDFYKPEISLDARILYKAGMNRDFYSNFDNIKGIDDVWEHELSLRAFSEYGVLKCLDVITGVQLGFHWNYEHESGRFRVMPQAMIGLRYRAI